ncbi:MAG: glucose-6-phosphate isomerase [Desulfobacteraceae bacterium]|nr:glucose-6-phosphate isomerase [Desulfobacteraceae bacterium]
MNDTPVNELPVWHRLTAHAEEMNLPENHLLHLTTSPLRLKKSLKLGAGVLLDFSRQRVTDITVDLLLELAEHRRVQERFRSMMAGEKINVTEKRAALHTAARCFQEEPVTVDGVNVVPELQAVREGIRAFAAKVHDGELRGSTGKAFRHVVVVGIGGSYLGTEFVSCALRAYADRGIALHYLANVDIHNFGRVVSEIDPESTLWVIISKSYTTAETLANARLAYDFMERHGLNPTDHVVTVTAKGSPGDNADNPVLGTFHMFDFIGGRYSVTSAVGGVPLSLYLGYDRFEAMLRGAEAMDRHAAEAPAADNLPLIAALLSVWNNNFLGYPAAGIIPYAAPLARLAPHVQQLNMESNGKSVTASGRPLQIPAGTILFGEPGTNAQHSFFQLAHQGRPFPIEFIGVLQPQYTEYHTLSRGVTNHQELWANLLAQADALAHGREAEDPARSFSGNRPSSTIVLKDLSPESVGRLLAFYEAKTVFEAFVWGINPFDQFGVELGKKTASGIREEMAEKNRNPAYGFDKTDDRTRHYLLALYDGDM